MFFYKRFDIPPNTEGFLYKRNKLVSSAGPGSELRFDPFGAFKLYVIPKVERQINISGSEILAKDLIAFRLSYAIRYKISNAGAFLEHFDIREEMPVVIIRAEERIHADLQVRLRNVISQFTSEEVLDKRDEISDSLSKGLGETTAGFGIEITALLLRDTNFPKNIQDLFSKRLESKIRAQADLENARTQVATARTLKNAAELMKGDENLKFIQMLELLEKIASRGKHTFIVGDVQNSSMLRGGP